MHEAVRCTPAMALGVTDHPWTIADLVDAALSAPEVPPVYTPPQKPLFVGMTPGRPSARGVSRRTQLQVIQGGKGRKRR